MTEPIEEIVDFFDYADAYFSACKTIFPKQDWAKSVKEYSDHKDRVFRVGPVYQNLGLATELTFKTSLLVSGFSKRNVTKLGHNLEKLLGELRNTRDLNKVDDRAFEAATLVGPPPGMLQRIEKTGQSPQAWYLFSTHIRSLNSNYNLFEMHDGGTSAEKFRSRYPAKDRAYREVCVEAIIAGLDTLMEEIQTELNQRLSKREN
ncbi:hypothetical protein [Ruegeria atlantica]|uniref:hypothetical protein n=1 Tax=Ruegeria atlantica TaxID=81569 RepID=UPI00147E9FD4|nr:hypothetical protein [Ruegeria atlantica]